LKKTLLAFAVLGAFAGGAAAQSSVTLFGVMDLGLRHVSNEGVGGRTTMVSGSNATSRFGFRGTEDLGNGLSAGFWLESGFAADVGTSAVSNQFWDRESFLFLKSATLGELRAGRDLTQVYKVWSAADPFSQVGAGSVFNLYPASSSTSPTAVRAAFGSNDRNASSTTRANNMLAYSLPGDLGGLVGGAFFAYDEGSVDTTSARGLKVGGVSLGYAKGPLSVMAGYAKTRAPGTVENFSDRALHAIYDFGFLKFSLANRHYKFRAADQDIIQLGLWIPVGSAGLVKASYGTLSNKGTIGATSLANRDVKTFGLGYQHSLSKRTAVYGTLGVLSNDSLATNTFSGGNTGMVAGGRSRAIEFGLRHNF